MLQKLLSLIPLQVKGDTGQDFIAPWVPWPCFMDGHYAAVASHEHRPWKQIDREGIPF